MKKVLHYIIKNEINKENMQHKIDATNAMMMIIIILMAMIFLSMLFSSN